MNERKTKELQTEPSVSKTESSTPELLKEKRAIISGLVVVINMLPRDLTPWEKEDVEALEFGLTDRVAKLKEQFLLQEADIKIEQMRKLIALLKHE